jgi:hypothetical protein
MESTLSPVEKAKILIDIRAVIESPENWTVGTLARPSDGGAPVNAFDQDAARFCLLGASQIASKESRVHGENVLAEILPYQPDSWLQDYERVGRWNDAKDRRHIEVLQTLDEGIKKFDPTYVPPRMSLWAWFKSWRYRGY